MPKLVKLLSKALSQLQTQLLTSREQLTQQQNPDALHDLRICLRQLRSLLQPLRPYLDEATILDRLVKTSMTLTNNIRDREVLIIELKQQQMFELADDYQQHLQSAYLAVAQQAELDTILQQLLSLPAHWQSTFSTQTADQLKRHICHKWRQHNRKLRKLIKQKTPDKHSLRIIIKQLRYSSEIYKSILPNHASKQTQQLKALQALLGTWHDYFVWIEYAQHQTALNALVPVWQQQLAFYEHKSNQALKLLKRDFLS